jgi:hypothetical protein
MKDCEYMTPDDYPCPDEGSIKVGKKHYCLYHVTEITEGDNNVSDKTQTKKTEDA